MKLKEVMKHISVCFESGLTGVLSDYFQSQQGLMRQSQRISNWILWVRSCSWGELLRISIVILHVDFCVKTEDSLFLSLVYRYNLKCRVGRGKGEGLISISVVPHRMSGFRVQMMTVQLSFSDNDSAAVLFWEWQCSCAFLIMTVRVQVSCSDNDSVTVLFW